MALLQLRSISAGFGGHPLLEGVDLTIESGERLALLGRNGSGKSTLMKVVSDELQADDGERQVRQELRIARLTQEVPSGDHTTLFEVVAAGLGESGALLARYHELSHQLQENHTESLLKQLEQTQHRLEASGGWHFQQQVESIISRLGLPADARFTDLSGGVKRRALLAQALIQEPDLLLLDEPTNHLDIAAIDWLEELLLGLRGTTLLFVSHDRRFLQKLSTRIIELDRGKLNSWSGNYQDYLRYKEAALKAEEEQNAKFDKKLAQEETWIRQGIKARRTRNEGRVRALEKLREQYKNRRQQTGKVEMAVQQAERSGKIVIETDQLGYCYGDRWIVRDLSTTILRGDKVGIIGPNGCGKSTLLNLLLGQLEPQHGSIKQGSNLQIAYFDQLRAQLDPERSVIDNLADGSDKVEINGQSRHVISYLQEFLFTPDRARTPVKALSGGECNRLLLARIFAQPSNLLVMDEPTNDLDIETLELLEERLLEYSGTLLLVSHDREFLDNVVTNTLVFEEGGRLQEYVGGYQDWLRQRPQTSTAKKPEKSNSADTPKPKPSSDNNKNRKLSYKDQRELDQLPKLIEALELEQEQLHARLADPDFYQQGGDAISETNARLQQLDEELEQAYSRWESLEG